MTLDIIIVNYNVKHYLQQCLGSVQQAIEGIDATVWVVDNKSCDESVDYLQPRFPWVRFVRNEENVGFSRANNKAIRMGSANYVLLLNPDTLVTTAAIQDCIRLMDSQNEVGAIGVSMFNSDGTFAKESKRAIPTAMVSFYKMSGLSTLFPRHKKFARYHFGFLDIDKPHEIEVVSGAFFMIRRKALDEVGLLDEDFFMYGEDIDLSYRLLKGGWKNWYLPAPILHYKGESAHPSTIRYVNVFHEAMIIFYDKHFRDDIFSTWIIRFAVYFKAFLTLFAHAIRFCKSKVVRKNPIYTACLYCQNDAKEKITQKLREHNIVVVSTGDSPDFALFDKRQFTYDQMLRMLTSQTSGKRFQLGIYDEECGKIVLPREVIEL